MRALMCYSTTVLLATYAEAFSPADVGQDVQMSGEDSGSRRLTQQPQTAAEGIYMHGVSDFGWGTAPATIKNGESVVSSSIQWGEVACFGEFNTTKEISVHEGSKTMGPVKLPAHMNTGNMIWYSDLKTRSQIQFQAVRLNYDSMQPSFDAGKGVVGFFSLVYGESFQVFFANTNQRIVSSISNMQSSKDFQAKSLDPSLIASDAQGFELRNMDLDILATTPHSVKDFIKPGKVTIVFIVGDPSNLAKYPMKIVATDLSCNLVSDSLKGLPTTSPTTSGSLPLTSVLWPLAAATLGFAL